MNSTIENECLIEYIKGDKKSVFQKLEAFVKNETSYGGEVSEDGAHALILHSELLLFEGDMYESLGLLNRAREVYDAKENSSHVIQRILSSKASILKLQGLIQESNEIFQEIIKSSFSQHRDTFFTVLKLIHFYPTLTSYSHAHYWYESLKLYSRDIALLLPKDTYELAILLLDGLQGFETCDILELLVERLNENDPIQNRASQKLKELEQIHIQSDEIEDRFTQNPSTVLEKALLLVKSSPFEGDRTRLYSLIGDYYLSEGKLPEAFEIFNDAEDLILKSKKMREHESAGFIFHNLSILYGEQGNYRAALSRIEHALNIRKNYFDADHPAIIESENAYSMIKIKLESMGHPIQEKLDPQKESITSAIGLIEAGKLNEALKVLKKLLS